MTTRQVKITDYLAGACLANAPAFFLALILSFINMEIPTTLLLAVTFLTIFVGSAVAGFFIAGKASRKHMQIGAAVGAMAFIVHAVYFILLRSAVGGWWIMIGFILGGIVGGKLQEFV